MAKKNLGKLIKKQVRDKNGKMTTVYVRPDEAPKTKEGVMKRVKPKINEAQPKEFREAMIRAVGYRKTDALQVTVKDEEDYQAIIDNGGKLFLSEDKTIGAYVDGTGYMGSLFKNPSSEIKGAAKILQMHRIKHGGRFFDAYATYLEPLYIKNGFRPVARLKFNEEYAPKGWKNTTLKDKPDVVFFAYDPDGEYKVGDGDYFEDWDEALDAAYSFSQKSNKKAA